MNQAPLALRPRNVLALVAVLAATFAPNAADAQGDQRISLTYGQSIARGDTEGTRPVLRLEGMRQFVGPFYGGLYGELIGTDGFLSDPSFAGGTVIRLRPQFGSFPLVPFIDTSIGRTRMPLLNGDHDGVWDIRAGGGIALQFSHFGIEARATHVWYRSIDKPGVPDRAVLWSAGFNVQF